MSRPQRLPRASGLLLHVTSLPSVHGIGDMGPEARRFVDFLSRTGQSLWQVLPVGPTGAGYSPYQARSAFAGNELLVSLEQLADEGWLTLADLQCELPLGEDRVDYEVVTAWKRSRLAMACQRFRESGGLQTPELNCFRDAESDWLYDYALFTALQHELSGGDWTAWPTALARREPAALAEARRQLASEIELEEFIQFQFLRQWSDLHAYARARHVRIMGDIPIFVAHESADVWANQSLFDLDASGRSRTVAGVPPDYFSVTGQLWGNPLYRWDRMARSNYAWWIRRFRHAFRLFDLVRLDHFRGFEAFWCIPANARDARGGKWVQGPGEELFIATERELGDLPLVAEDLGVITPAVDALRDAVGAPGMRVLQFAFRNGSKISHHQPHNFPNHCVVYTGTHDNNTTVGWFRELKESASLSNAADDARELATAREYLGTNGDDIAWDLLRLAWGSVADTAIAPLQDVLSLGAEARLNLPGSPEGNWRWRFRRSQITPRIESRLAGLTRVYGRAPLPGDVTSGPRETDDAPE